MGSHLCWLCLLLAGCFASHGREDVDGGRDAGERRDVGTGVDARVLVDAGSESCLPVASCEVTDERSLILDGEAFGGVAVAQEAPAADVIVVEVDSEQYLVEIVDGVAAVVVSIGAGAIFSSTSRGARVAMELLPPGGEMELLIWDTRTHELVHRDVAPVTLEMTGTPEGFALIEHGVEEARLVTLSADGDPISSLVVDLGARVNFLGPALRTVDDGLVLVVGDDDGCSYARWMRFDGSFVREDLLLCPEREGCRVYPARVGRARGARVPITFARFCEPELVTSWRVGILEREDDDRSTFQHTDLPCARWGPVFELDGQGARALFATLNGATSEVWTVSIRYDQGFRERWRARLSPRGRIPGAFFDRDAGYVIWGAGHPERERFLHLGTLCTDR